MEKPRLTNEQGLEMMLRKKMSTMQIQKLIEHTFLI